MCAARRLPLPRLIIRHIKKCRRRRCTAFKVQQCRREVVDHILLLLLSSSTTTTIIIVMLLALGAALAAEDGGWDGYGRSSGHELTDASGPKRSVTRE